MKLIISILFILVNSFCSAQTFEKTFSGQWATTSWTFEFHKDGTYKRISQGHYGNTEVKGNYSIHNDSIQLNHFENTHGTINKYYLLDGDSFLVDLELLYDYKLNASPWFYSSRKREDIEFQLFMTEHPGFISFKDRGPLYDHGVDDENYKKLKIFLKSKNENIEDYYLQFVVQTVHQGGELHPDSWMRFSVYHINTMYAWLKFKKENPEEYKQLNGEWSGPNQMVGNASGKDGVIEINYTTGKTGMEVFK